jgi:hypothetical protein
LVSSTSLAFAGSKLDPVGAADSDTIKGTVLVWHDAQLLVEPKEDARSIQLATFDVARKERVGHVFAMKVVSAQPGFVEVELDDTQHCTWSHVVVPDDYARVRLFVRRADLAPVLTKPFTKTFANNTSVTLAPGTPLLASDAGTYVVSMRGAEVEVDVPAAQVAYSYAMPKSSAVAMAGQTLQVAAGTKAMLGDRTITLTGFEGAPIQKTGDATLVAIETRCATAKVSIPTGSLKDTDEAKLELEDTEGGTTLSLRDEFFIPRLTPLNAGTRMVAVAAKPIYLHSEPFGKNACIERKIGVKSELEIAKTDVKLRLCAPATKVVREGMRSARSAHGSTRR